MVHFEKGKQLQLLVQTYGTNLNTKQKYKEKYGIKYLHYIEKILKMVCIKITFSGANLFMQLMIQVQTIYLIRENL